MIYHGYGYFKVFFFSYSELCFIYFHVVLPNFCKNIHRFTIQCIGLSYECKFFNEKMQDGKKNYWSKSQITLSILITLDSAGSIFNTLIAYQEKQTRTGNIPKEVAALKDSARGRFNLHSCCLHVGLLFLIFLLLLNINESVPSV